MTNIRHITKEEILSSLNDGRVQLITDPNTESGTVCQIGEHWFYFGGQTTEMMTPEEYRNYIPEEDIAREIVEVLSDFREDSDYNTEYLYYMYYLRENAGE